MTTLNNNSIIRREVVGVEFGVYTDEEIRNRSVIEITSPLAHDSLGTALPRGLYDPMLGPTESSSPPCITCGNTYLQCPGHSGHIELCVPVYHPLLFRTMFDLLKLKCFVCHKFRLSELDCAVYAAKLNLIDCGLSHKIEELNRIAFWANPSNKAARSFLQNNSSDNISNDEEFYSKASKQLSDILRQALMETPSSSSSSSKYNLGCHERSLRQELIKSFRLDCMSKQKCMNCSARNPKLRQDSNDKLFQRPLSKRDKQYNQNKDISILPALVFEQQNNPHYAHHQQNNNNNAFMDTLGYESDDSVEQISATTTIHEDMSAITTNLHDHNSQTTPSEEEKEKKKKTTNYDDESTEMEKLMETELEMDISNNNNNVDDDDMPDAINQGDKFMHPLEVEAQIRLTWTHEPILCSKVFGSAHIQPLLLPPQQQQQQQQNNNNNNNIHQSRVLAMSRGWTLFFLRVVPVPPSRFRPPIVVGEMTVEHAQNTHLSKILSTHEQLRKDFVSVHEHTRIVKNCLEEEEQNDNGNDDDNADDDVVIDLEQAQIDRKAAQRRSVTSWIALQGAVNTFMDNTKGPQKSSSVAMSPGIRQLIERKEGLFRKNMMGKRVDYACRSVISPDPYIGTNEIGLPLHFAKALTYPTPVTHLNIEEMRRLVERGPNQYPGALWVEYPNSGYRRLLRHMNDEARKSIAARLLSSGGSGNGGSGGGVMKVGRQLRDGDYVVMNRQPTLHKPGMMGHRVRILHNPTQTTIRMHYANCNTYNADFDGDEMNCHFPQNDLARAECEFIAGTDLQYIVPTNGSPLRGLIQDHVDSGVKLTKRDTFLERWEYQQLLFAALSSLPGLELIPSYDDKIEMMVPAIRKPRELWTGKQVISTLLFHLRMSTDNNSRNDNDDNNAKKKMMKKKKRAISLLPGVSMEKKSKMPATALGESSSEHLVLVRDGELLRGVLDKGAFGDTDYSLVHAVYEAYGPRKAGLLLNSLGRLFSAYLQYFAGHSCRLEDLVLTNETEQRRRALVQRAYNLGSRAAKAWADSDGGKVEIKSFGQIDNDDDDDDDANRPLKPVESARAGLKIGQLLTGQEGTENAAALDGYMQSQLNPLASKIIKTCLPNGLAVPFPKNTFGLMVATGAKGSTVNQSQVSCSLGQQALEGRRVPRLSSGRTLPSFTPYDPNPRADGFITDRFLTGIRPQEYYFHCMAGREGLVDTAVKTSRSGYLQRCLIKHLEELKVCYDSTVRDGEGTVVQFLYGEDGIDPTKAAYLDGSMKTLQYVARNHKALNKMCTPLPNSTIEVAVADHLRSRAIEDGRKVEELLTKGGFVLARKLRFGSEWKRGALCRGWYDAIIVKRWPGGQKFDLMYLGDGSRVRNVPREVEFKGVGSKTTPAASGTCTIVKVAAPGPILSDFQRDGGRNRVGSSGICVSEKMAGATVHALESDKLLQEALRFSGTTAEDFKRLMASKFSSGLCAPGEAVGSIAAQSIGEPSTQMTLNTFHLAGSGANVTLGIPRLREIIMTASKELKTPTMSVPLRSSVSDRDATRLARSFQKLTLSELLSNHRGIEVVESLEQSESGEWLRTYRICLKFHDAERMKEAFDLTLADIAAVVSVEFMAKLTKIMGREMKRAASESGVRSSSVIVRGTTPSAFARGRNSKDDDREDGEDFIDDGDDDVPGEEDGVTSKRLTSQEQMASYGEMDEEDKQIAEQAGVPLGLFDSDNDESDESVAKVRDDASATTADGTAEEDHVPDQYRTSKKLSLGLVEVDENRNVLFLQPVRVDPSGCPLLMVGLVEQAAMKTLVKSRDNIDQAFINKEEGRGRCLQTAGINFEEMWNLHEDIIDHSKLLSNDTWAVRLTYGVEAARSNIVEQIRSVFAVYGISVDPRHLGLVADYMACNGGYRPMNRAGMAESGSSFLQMSFETTANFMLEAAKTKLHEPMMSPSANIVMGRPVRHGTGSFECLVAA